MRPGKNLRGIKVHVAYAARPASDLDLKLLSVGKAMKAAVASAGGRAVALWLDRVLTIWISGVNSSEVQQLLQLILEAGQRHGATMAVSQLDGIELPWQVVPEEFSQTGEFRWQKLTEQFFFGLDDETTVVSTVTDSDRKPRFQAYLGKKPRSELWRDATQALAAQGNCIAIREPDCGLDYDLVI